MKLNPLASLVASLALVSVVAACSERERAPGQWPVAKDELHTTQEREDPGELTYRRYCVGCHGADGRGNEGTTGADLTAASGPLATKSDDVLIASVRDGKVGKLATMPPHKPVLKDPQIAEVIRYVRSRFGPGKVDASTPAP